MSGKLQMTPELKKRIQTAIVGVAVLILLLTVGGSFGAVIVSAVISLGMLYEFVDISFGLPDKKEKRFVLLGSAWLIAFLNFWIPSGEFALLVFFFLAITMYFLFTVPRYPTVEEARQHYKELMYSIGGFVYLVFLPTYLVSLRQSAFGVHWTMLFLLIVWSSDTGAYFAGHKWGRKKLFPSISPKKTWEGAYGGTATAVVVSILYKLAFFPQLSWTGALVIPVIVSSLAPVGDLAESFLKRAFDKKDSSSILPGHGGFLDRFDAVVFTLPVMYALTRIFGAI